MTVVEDLAAWLTAVWDEEERLAKLAGGDRWILDGGIVDESHPSREVVDWVYDDADEHIAYHDPASVLARIAADRRILARCKAHLPPKEDAHLLSDVSRALAVVAEATIQDLAEPYAAHPEWLVERQGVEG